MNKKKGSKTCDIILQVAKPLNYRYNSCENNLLKN